jgi:hypothetical protein
MLSASNSSNESNFKAIEVWLLVLSNFTDNHNSWLHIGSAVMRRREGFVLLLFMDWQEWQQSWLPLIDHIWVLVWDLYRYVKNLHEVTLFSASCSFKSASLKLSMVAIFYWNSETKFAIGLAVIFPLSASMRNCILKLYNCIVKSLPLFFS